MREEKNFLRDIGSLNPEEEERVCETERVPEEVK